MTFTPFDLTGRTAAVTGASAGIGEAIAFGLAAAGADIIAVARRGNEQLAARVADLGRGYTEISCDLGDPAAVRDLVADLVDADILVNNAGMIRRSPAVDYSAEDWADVLQVNLTAAWTLAQGVGAHMIGRGWGRVINTASLLSFQGGVFVPAYTASKHAIAGLTKALANEWTAKGVTVNAIAPGYIATDNTSALRADPERSKSILDRIPAGRWGAPEDIAGAAVFLASPAAGYVSGHVLAVDGGWLAR